ncbi:class I SAM-dependent methyltransferase [Candidatus Leptofilum sp.]|uniref:class I SAM-dependent methyltransferase n=1 Tax=Candidatus Leptofilum sp. TaxID=3241576 RepID=UPI003B5ACBEF
MGHNLLQHQNLFSDKSEIYLNARPRYPEKLYSILVDLCENHERVWDAACGNGQASIDLANHFTKVLATDISNQQIANAIAHPKVEYSVQPSESTNFKESSFDLVCVAQALHWFDFEKFWPEVHRVLKPNGIFAAWGYSWFKILGEIDAIIEQAFMKKLEPYWAKQNQLLWDHYIDVPFPFLPQNMPPIEMSMYWDLNELFAYLHSWSATRRCMAAQGDAFFVDSYEKVAEVWGQPDQKRKVVMDFCVMAGRFV